MSKVFEASQDRVALQVHDAAVAARSTMIREYIEHVTDMANAGYVDYLEVAAPIRELVKACGESSQKAFAKRSAITDKIWKNTDV